MLIGPIILKTEIEVKKFVAFLKGWHNIKTEEKWMSSDMNFAGLARMTEVVK